MTMAGYTETEVAELRAYQLIHEAYSHVVTAAELSDSANQSEATDTVVRGLVRLSDELQNEIGLPHDTIMEMFGD